MCGAESVEGSAPVLFLGGKGKRKVCRACRDSILKWC